MQDSIRDLAPVVPSVTVASLTLFGISLADWVLVVTLIYTVVQLILALPRLWNTVKGWFK